MKFKFKQIAVTLQRQVLTRIILGGLFILLFVILICATKDIVLSFPCIVLGCYLAVNGIIILYNCLADRVITVIGKCVEIEKSRIFKRVKSIYIQTKDIKLKVMVRRRIRGLGVDKSINLYIPETAQLYEKDGIFFTGTFYAIEVATS